MQVENITAQNNEVVELALDDIEIVSGGYPVSPPPGTGG
jgi:hypothetical protein